MFPGCAGAWDPSPRLPVPSGTARFAREERRPRVQPCSRSADPSTPTHMPTSVRHLDHPSHPTISWKSPLLNSKVVLASASSNKDYVAAARHIILIR